MKKILLVEDDPKITKALSFVLQEEGFEVVCASDGPSGLEMARTRQPDIVLLDIMLPGMNGVEVCRALKSDEEFKAIPVIMLTALGDTENMVKGLSAGASDYISKPFDFQELLARLRSNLKMKELFDAAKKEEKEKSVLLDISHALSSTLDPHDTLYTIVTKIAEVIEVKRCSVIYIDASNRKGYVMSSHDSKEIRRLEIDLERYPEIQKVMETGKPVVIHDVYNDPILFRVRDVLSMIDVKSIMAFPILFKNSLIGTLILRTSRRETPFTDRETKFCQVLSHLAASPLKNAYLFEILHLEKEKEREGRIVAEAKSRVSRELLENIKETNPAPLCVFDREGKITDLNNAYLREFVPDSTKEEKFGQDIFKYPQDRQFPDLLQRVLKGEKLEMEIDLSSGGEGDNRTYILQGTPLYGGENNQIGGMFSFHNITERKKAEERIKSQNEQLIFLNKDLETARKKAEEGSRLKTEFLANISHELRTPLTSIIGFSKLMDQDEGLTHELKEYVEIINQQGRNLMDLINDLLDLSKIEMDTMSFDFSMIGINRLLKEVVLSQERKIMKKRHRVIERFEEGLPELWLDWNKATQVFKNLIANAVKFTPEGGEITLITQRKGDLVEGIVQDNGVGIREEDLGVIFDRFRQLDGTSTRKHGGMGLGLDLVKNLVEKMNGSIWVESEPGKGSSFFVSFPAGTSSKPGGENVSG